MRRNVLLSLFFAVLIYGIFSMVSCSCNNEITNLSELGDEALIQYLDEESISIPEGIDITSVREMLVDLEAVPDRHPLVVGYSVLYNFYEELRMAVKKHGNATP